MGGKVFFWIRDLLSSYSAGALASSMRRVNLKGPPGYSMMHVLAEAAGRAAPKWFYFDHMNKFFNKTH